MAAMAAYHAHGPPSSSSTSISSPNAEFALSTGGFLCFFFGWCAGGLGDGGGGGGGGLGGGGGDGRGGGLGGGGRGGDGMGGGGGGWGGGG
eukprot:2149623-Prymnesium_polylepis.2